MNELYKIDESYYYVYEHWLNGQVVYVGKGKESRAVELRRNNYWKETVKDDFFNLKVVIKAYFKDEKDAFDYEKTLIHRHLKNNQPLTNIEYGNIEPGFGYETKNTKKEINIKVMNEMRFFKESEVTKIIEKNIKDNGKVILFSSGFNRSLIHLVERINNVKLLELSISEAKNTKSKTSFIEKGVVPEPYNVIIFPTEIISLSRLEVVDEKVKSVIINDKFIDKSIILQKINKDLEFLYLKKNPKVVMNKTINPEIVKKYLNRQLTTSDKSDLCEELNIANTRGTDRKWISVKPLMIKVGYEVEDKIVTLDGKATRVSIITDPKGITKSD